MSQQIYREQLIDHYKNPRNEGSLDGATNTAELKNLSCGDEISISLKTSDGRIEDIKFKGSGCAICIASMSILSEILLGESIDFANKLDFESMQEFLGLELSPSRIKCAHLGLLTVQKALSK